MKMCLFHRHTLPVIKLTAYLVLPHDRHRLMSDKAARDNKRNRDKTLILIIIIVYNLACFSFFFLSNC